MKEFESTPPSDESHEFFQEFLGQTRLSAGDRESILIDGTALHNGSVHLPVGRELLSADFARVGHDLYITASDDATHIVSSYFNHESIPALLSEDGQKIPGHAVNLLAGPEAAGQYAGPSGGSESIGTVEKLSGIVEVKHADGTETTLKQGDPVFQNDVIQTGTNGDLGIKFQDGSVFTLGSDARMTLDDLVYDPDTGEGHSSVTVVEGMFKFVSGEISANNPGEMQIHTPVATIGIRGTTGGGSVQGEGQDNQFYLEPNADGTVGWFDVTTDKGTQSINQPNMVVSIASMNLPPPPPQIVPAAVIQQRFGEVIQFAPPVDKYSERSAESSNNTPAPQGETPAANAEGQPNGDAAPANAPSAPQAEAAPQGEQPNAQFTTDAPAAEQAVANAETATDPLTPFSGDAQFDGQANTAPENGDQTPPPAFIPTGVASADIKPGFTATGTDGFVAASPTATTSAFAPNTAAGQPGAATNINGGTADGNGPIANATGSAPSVIVTTTVVGGVTPPAPGSTTGVYTGASGSIAPPPAPNHAANVIADQQNSAPPIGPAPSTVLPPAPPAAGAGTGTGTNPPPPGGAIAGGGGGGSGSGTTEAAMNFLMTAGNDSFTGGTGNDNFLATTAAFLSNNDTLTGGAGLDSLIFQTAAPITDTLLTNVTGIDALVFNAAGNTVTFTSANTATVNAFFETTDTGKLVLKNGAHDVMLDASGLDWGHEVLIGGIGPVSLTNNSNRVSTQFNTQVSITGGTGDDMVVAHSAHNSVISLGGGDNVIMSSGGNGNTLQGGTGSSSFIISNESNIVINGGTNSMTDGDYFELSNVSNVVVNSSAVGISEYYLYGTNTNVTINGSTKSQVFDITGNGSGLTFVGGTNSSGGMDQYFFHSFNGSASVTADVYSGFIDKFYLDGLKGTVVVSLSEVTPSSNVDLEFGGLSYSDLTFAKLDGSAAGSDLRITTSQGGTVILQNYFTGSNFDNYNIKSHYADPYQYITGTFTDTRDLSDVQYKGSNGKDITSSAANVSAGADTNAEIFGTGKNDVIASRTNAGGQNVYGYDGNDTLTAAYDGVSISGGAGDDRIIKLNGLGTASLDGGAGFDLLDYSQITGNLFVNLGTQVVSGAATDYITNTFEGVIGGIGDDTFSGGTNDEWFEGGAGADSINGGSGRDTLSYAGSSTYVVVNLGTPSASNGDAAGDIIVGMENIVGSAHNDYLTGDNTAGGNIIYGGAGNDFIDGASGKDTLIGGDGNDTIDAGSSDGVRDIIVYNNTNASGNSTKDTINNFFSNGTPVQNDAINVSAWVEKNNLHDMNVFDLLRGGYLVWNTDGTNASVGFDSDGSAGGNSIVNLAQLNGTTYLDWSNFVTHNETFITSGATTLSAGGNGQYIMIGTTAGMTITGGSNDDIMYCTSAANIFNAAEGNDTIIVDTISMPGGAQGANGGSGFDTLYILNSGTIDVNSVIAPKTASIERIDISAVGSTHLTNLSVSNVFSISSDDSELFIDRDATDVVDIDSGVWKVSTDASLQENGYTTYVGGTGSDIAILHVQNT